MQVDMTINLGHIIQIIGYILAAVGLYYGIRIDLVRKEEKILQVHETAKDAKLIAIDAANSVHTHVEKFHTTKGVQ